MCEKVRSLHGIFRSNRGAWPPDTGDVKGHDPDLRVFVVDWARLYHIRVHLWFIRPDCPVTGCASISAASPCPWIQSGTPSSSHTPHTRNTPPPTAPGRPPEPPPAQAEQTEPNVNRRHRIVKKLPRNRERQNQTKRRGGGRKNH